MGHGREAMSIRIRRGAKLLGGVSALAVLLASGHARADNVVPDDQIVQGSQCVGFDCVDNESFGFATQVLKENNTRMLLNDTSVGAFPSNNWGLIANDASSGGRNYFAIGDLGANGTLSSGNSGNLVFGVEAGAPANSLWINSLGGVQLAGLPNCTSGIGSNATGQLSCLGASGPQLVHQDPNTRDILIGDTTDGTLINVAGTAGNRRITGLLDGSISSGSSDAVTGGQLFTANQRVASVFGGGAGLDA